MKNLRIALLLFIILINSIFASGCWNYKEIDTLAIVAGVAVDKGIKNQFLMTVEIILISSGKESKMTSNTIEAEGKTMFDAARNIISLSGKRLYWSHAKIIILSKEIASEGVTSAIAWYNRDTETREDTHLLISEGESAKEILNGQGITEDIKSFVLDQILDNQVSLSKSPVTDILKFDIESQAKGISAVIPTVNITQINEKMVPQVMGTAIIKNKKLVGFLNGEETKDLLFIKNEVKGGLLIEEFQSKDVPTFVSLEIFKSKTKVSPFVDGRNINIDLNIETIVAIDEINGFESFMDEDGQKKLEQIAENTLKKRVEALIKKMQLDYDTDIFGFGAKLREDKIQTWNSVGNNWDEVFKDLKVNVKTKVHIKNSAILSKNLEAGD